jgi:hypothetical protein
VVPLWHGAQGDEVAILPRRNEGSPGLFPRRKSTYMLSNEGPKETIGRRSTVRLQLMTLWRFFIFE